jgi:hypothetical protein
MAYQVSNTVSLVDTEQLANSLGGPTIIANSVQFTNSTANGSSIKFEILGQSLPITNGSITVYPPVNLQVYCGANGNATDTLLCSATILPTLDQNGGFLCTGLVMLKANAKSALNAIAGGVNVAVGAAMWSQSTALAGDAKTLLCSYAGAAVNGNANVCLSTSNVANLSFLAQPVTGQNANASITAIWVQTFNSNVQTTTSGMLV